MGAAGAAILALANRKLTWSVLKHSCYDTLKTTAMVMMLFIGGKFFSTVFLSMGGGDVVADVLVAHKAELPWGRGKRRAPRKREDFDAACRFLRDRDTDDDLESLSAILDSVELAPLPPQKPLPVHRVTFFRGRQVLSVDGVRMALPMGRELAFLTLLAERRWRGEVTPRFEHEIDWKNAVDQLRKRIRRATGRSLLRAVVLTALPPVGGYRLTPGVRVRRD